MITPPSGIVTFLFTDIEGSTKLAQEFPDTLPVALEKHHAILRKKIESNNGFVFEIIGDAFCSSFADVCDAVKAAHDIQISLASEKWDDAVIKIRIGIHSGKAEWNNSTYMGYITLARTQRVMSAAFGEQVIISNDTNELVKEKILLTNKEIRSSGGEIISFRDLGERRLKDLIQPVKLYQMTAHGLREEFPPLKTLDARPNNLPLQLTSFIGREDEMKKIKDGLKQTRLLTLTGPGGTGKTRLAIQIAADIIDDFANGVWIVELASLLEPDLLPQSIVKALGIHENPKQKVEETLSDFLKDKELLIILDNCEHLIHSCAGLSERLLQYSAKLKILATSREPLRCSGELTHRTSSLALPDAKADITAEQLSQYESVRLFIERALALKPDFRVTNENAPALAAICSHLDGIPLAIELAAARISVLTIEKIYERLNSRFKLLTGGKRTSLPRQQTLKALIDWSYDLLSENEKILWSRLSVFSGGWTLEASEEICIDEKIFPEEVLDLIINLTDKSIVIYDEKNQRYRMLETIKQYGAEKLEEANEHKKVADSH
ncbi:MAG: adenylate/guanylate cyclase domain-containing protein, partial [Ignavibacteria bacterium]